MTDTYVIYANGDDNGDRIEPTRVVEFDNEEDAAGQAEEAQYLFASIQCGVAQDLPAND